MPKNKKIEIGDIQVHLEEIMLPMGLLLASVDVKGRELRIESHPLLVEVKHRATFSARLRTENMAEFLNEKAPGGIKNVSVTGDGGLLYLEGTKTILVDVPVKASCRLRIEGGNQIHVDLISVDVLGSGVKNLLQGQLQKINPVLDSDDFPVIAHFEGIEIEDNIVTVTGTMEPRR